MPRGTWHSPGGCPRVLRCDPAIFDQRVAIHSMNPGSTCIRLKITDLQKRSQMFSEVEMMKVVRKENNCYGITCLKPSLT